MKNLLLSLLVLFAINTAKAQITYSIGSEIGYSVQEYFGAQFGFSIGGEYEINETMAVNLQTGYSYIMIPDFDASFAANVPLLAGFKYSLDDKVAGMYVMGQLGIHFFSYTLSILEQNYSDNFLELGTGVSVGYLIGEHIDLNLHVNAILGEDVEDDGMGTFSYIAARIAYKF